MRRYIKDEKGYYFQGFESPSLFAPERPAGLEVSTLDLYLIRGLGYCATLWVRGTPFELGRTSIKKGVYYTAPFPWNRNDLGSGKNYVTAIRTLLVTDVDVNRTPNCRNPDDAYQFRKNCLKALTRPRWHYPSLPFWEDQKLSNCPVAHQFITNIQSVTSKSNLDLTEGALLVGERDAPSNLLEVRSQMKTLWRWFVEDYLESLIGLDDHDGVLIALRDISSNIPNTILRNNDLLATLSGILAPYGPELGGPLDFIPSVIFEQTISTSAYVPICPLDNCGFLFARQETSQILTEFLVGRLYPYLCCKKEVPLSELKSTLMESYGRALKLLNGETL